MHGNESNLRATLHPGKHQSAPNSARELADCLNPSVVTIFVLHQVYRKDPIYTEKVDVFSLSMIMFYLATGLPAYVGESDITR